MHSKVSRSLVAAIAPLLLGLSGVSLAADDLTQLERLALRPVAEVSRAQPTLVIDAFQHDTAFYKQTTPGSAEPDLGEVLLGTRSMRVSTEGDGVQVNLRAEGVGPYDLGGAYLKLLLKVDAMSELHALYLYLSNDGFDTYDTYLVLGGPEEWENAYLDDGSWGTITTALGQPLWAEPRVDLSNVTDIQLSVVDNGSVPVTVWFAGLEAAPAPERGVVTVMFDDARSGVFELALPQAQRHGVRASVAVISDLVDVPGFMSSEELRTLEHHAGWELVAHHESELPDGPFDQLGEDALRGELEGIKRWLLERGFRRGADVIAYPNGAFTDFSTSVTADYFAAGRTILGRFGNETLPPADPYRIRARSVIDTDTTESLWGAIDQAATERSWLILVFHQFSNSPTEYETEYSGIDFARVMAYLAGADVDVLTFSEALLGR